MYNPQLPLLDLHRHLDGNIRPETILALGQQHQLALPGQDLHSLLPHVQIQDNEPSLVAFLAKLDWGVKVLADLDAVSRVAYENIEDLKRAGIDYAELRFSPYYMAMTHQLPIAAVVEAVIDGVNRGQRDFGVPAKLIGILSRTFGIEACQQELDGLLAHKAHLTAIDLAGDELGQPGPLFEDHFRQVRQTDLAITIHAGEAAGAESIWHAIDTLGATRIGHGVKAVEDPRLLDELAQRGIGMESCLTSNVQTSTVASLQAHPVKTFLEHGLLATLNTDDPAVEGIELKYEFEVAAVEAGLSAAQIEQAQRNALQIAYLSDSERQALLRIKE